MTHGGSWEINHWILNENSELQWHFEWLICMYVCTLLIPEGGVRNSTIKHVSAVKVSLHFCMGVVVGMLICQFEEKSECCSVVDRDFPPCVGAAATPTHSLFLCLSFLSLQNPLVFNLSSFLT